MKEIVTKTGRDEKDVKLGLNKLAKYCRAGDDRGKWVLKTEYK